MDQDSILQRSTRPFSPSELDVDAAAQARAFWHLRRYTSLAYATRAGELLRRFVGGFDAWARQAPASETFFAHKALQSLYPPLSALDEAPMLLLKDRKARAYAALERAGFLAEIKGRGFNDGIAWIAFGYGLERAPSTGLFAWADRAVAMTAKIRQTVAAEWSYTQLLDQAPPPAAARLLPLPAVGGPVVAGGKKVPRTGVWLPIDVPGGCPNVLVEGRPAPPVPVEVMRVDTPAWRGDAESPPRPATTMYVVEAAATRWRLVWEDARYRAGSVPDESEFLGDDIAFPDDPPVHPPSS